MTPTELRACLEAIDWSQRGLARQINYHEGTVRQWARGALPIPDDVAAWLETLAAFHQAHPAPLRTLAHA